MHADFKNELNSAPKCHLVCLKLLFITSRRVTILSFLFLFLFLTFSLGIHSGWGLSSRSLGRGGGDRLGRGLRGVCVCSGHPCLECKSRTLQADHHGGRTGFQSLSRQQSILQKERKKDLTCLARRKTSAAASRRMVERFNQKRLLGNSFYFV